MTNPNATSAWILKPTLDVIKQRKHPGQSVDGFIRELLGNHTYTDNPDTLARLERYRTHPRETQDDLITNVLDQLEELEKQMVKRGT